MKQKALTKSSSQQLYNLETLDLNNLDLNFLLNFKKIEDNLFFKQLIVDYLNFFLIHTITDSKCFLTNEIHNLWNSYFNEWQSVLANSITCPVCKKSVIKQKYKRLLKELLIQYAKEVINNKCI